MTATKWLPEWDTELRRMVSERDLSAAQRARLLSEKFARHFSKSAVIGYCHRNAIPTSTLRTGERSPRAKAASDTMTAKRIDIAASRSGLVLNRVPGLKIDIDHEPSGFAVPLLDARYNQCRWPAAEDGSARIVCGAETDGGSWCDYHRNRVFMRPKDVGECDD